MKIKNVRWLTIPPWLESIEPNHLYSPLIRSVYWSELSSSINNKLLVLLVSLLDAVFMGMNSECLSFSIFEHESVIQLWQISSDDGKWCNDSTRTTKCATCYESSSHLDRENKIRYNLRIGFKCQWFRCWWFLWHQLFQRRLCWRWFLWWRYHWRGSSGVATAPLTGFLWRRFLWGLSSCCFRPSFEGVV